ncbi:MAG: hypothetical protein KatS3mg082_1789 [Nitrospiraceae bacterium]|nr:MAG: hypothetical protein KatS3mg082_1789 [Nitrospiraceae bacterium]
MPSKSEAQARTMRARCHGWKPGNPKIARIPREVACEYARADARTKPKKK